MNILLLAAGRGERFTKVGHPPKPLIIVDGIPMWQKVLENLLDQLPPYIQTEVYIATKEEYNIVSDKYNVIELEGGQSGAAYSALQALYKSGNHYANWYYEPLLVLNCDQLVFFDEYQLHKSMTYLDWDGMLFHFNEPNKEDKWGRSVIKNNMYRISEIVEKTPVSNHAHTGHYMFKHTITFINYAKRMIEQDIRVNGEHFLSPIYNLMIKDEMNVFPFWVNEFISLGIPKDLEDYVARTRDN